MNAQENAIHNNANFSSWVNTDSSGYYEHTLIAGDYWTSAYMDGYHNSHSQRSFESGGTYSVDYNLWHDDAPIANLDVWVHDNDTGDRLENVTIVLIGPYGNAVYFNAENGSAHIQVPGDSVYTVRAWNDDHFTDGKDIFMEPYGWYGQDFYLGSHANYAQTAIWVYDNETGEPLEEAWVYGDPSIQGHADVGQTGIGLLTYGPVNDDGLVPDWYMEVGADGYEAQPVESK